jgi:hypothetical protein
MATLVLSGCRYIYYYVTNLYRTNYMGFSLLLDSFGGNAGTHQMERARICSGAATGCLTFHYRVRQDDCIW